MCASQYPSCTVAWSHGLQQSRPQGHLCTCVLIMWQFVPCNVPKGATFAAFLSMCRWVPLLLEGIEDIEAQIMHTAGRAEVLVG